MREILPFLAEALIWTETGSDYTANGVVTQMWWMAREIGVVKLVYIFEETYSGEEPESGSLTFDLASSSLLDQPVIVTQPESMTVALDGSVTFTVEAEGPGMLTYQWIKGSDGSIDGATDASLTLSNVQPADAESYSVMVSNVNGSVTSAEVTLTVQTESQIVNVPDLALKNALLRKLGRLEGDLTVAEMESIIDFTATSAIIADLTGLETAANLLRLDLGRNRITDLSPLSGLVQLEQLRLSRNLIEDIGPLSGLTQLVTLAFFDNQVSDLNPVQNMNQLVTLWAGPNDIADIGVLANLTNLVDLRLAGNKRISNVAALRDLLKLQQLFLGGTQIADIAPLSGLVNMRRLSLRDNQIVDVTPLGGMIFLNLLEIDMNRIEDISSLDVLVNLTTAYVQHNRLDILPGADDRQVIDGWLNQGARMTFEPQDLVAAVSIPDPKLVAALRAALGKPTGDLTQTDLESLTTFKANNLGIIDLTGLEFAINLTELDLGGNQIVDLTPLTGLTGLTSLTLFTNQIVDVTPLTGLNKLTTLLLRLNSIVNIEPLQELTQLGTLWLGWNQISNIDPVSALVNLQVIELDGNQLITDLGPLAELDKLVAVTAADNLIKDVSPLTGLINMTILRINGNRITDLTVLDGLTRLRTVTVQNNFIDIAPTAASREVIDGWIAGGANVTFQPQNEPPDILSIIDNRDGSVRLEWVSQSGSTYQVQGSMGLQQWEDSGTEPVSGTGLRISITVVITKPFEFFRLRIN